MEMAVVKSRVLLILLLYLQNIVAQQCLNNIGSNNVPGFPPQIMKTSFGCNPVAQNGLDTNSALQGNVQQVNYQQLSNILQTPLLQQSNNQPQLNLQGNLLQSVKSMINSQLLKSSNLDVGENIFSNVNNFQQSGQNQRDIRNIINGNQLQMNYEQLSSTQNQPTSNVIMSDSLNKLLSHQPSSSYLAKSQPQQSFTFQFVPIEKVPAQANQQMFALPVHKIPTKDQSSRYTVSQPTTNSVPNQVSTVQKPSFLMIPGTHLTTAQNQPMTLSFPSAQLSSIQNQPVITTSQISQGQPVLSSVQNQPSSGFTQNQKVLEVPCQKPIETLDKQSLVSYVMSQMQGSRSGGNKLAPFLPAALSRKPEKSSSMKTLLPLIFNLLNEKKSCCSCPHCGFNNNEQPKSDPVISTGYSNQINYSKQNPLEVFARMTENIESSVEPTNIDAKPDNTKVADRSQNDTESSEEEEEDESEDSDEE